MAALFTLHFTATDADDGMLLREYLTQQHISKTALTDIKSQGAILVNNCVATVRCVLRAGDHITVQYPPETENTQMKGEAMPLEVIYEDDYILAVNKPAGISTIPSRLHPTGTLANAIVHYYAQTMQASAVHFVTRLDLDTSGLVLLAKHRHIHYLFSLAQQEQSIIKEYAALAEGILTPANGRIDKPIGRRDATSIRREILPDGQSASTLYRTVQTIQNKQSCYSLLRLQLLTGRTHQIRVHLSSIDHPLLGDHLYDGSCTKIKRQALHCASLQFHHPITGEYLSLECPLPEDMQRVLRNTESPRENLHDNN